MPSYNLNDFLKYTPEAYVAQLPLYLIENTEKIIYALVRYIALNLFAIYAHNKTWTTLMYI